MECERPEDCIDQDTPHEIMNEDRFNIEDEILCGARACNVWMEMSYRWYSQRTLDHVLTEYEVEMSLDSKWQW